MRKVLLTGANGFIGKHIIPMLIERNYEVHAVSRKLTTISKQRQPLFWHQCNLLDIHQQKHLLEKVKPTHMLHLAWITTPLEYWSSIENIHWLQASLSLTMNFVATGGKRAVFAGSCAEYDWTYGYLTEGVTPKRPSSLYGTCKHTYHCVLRKFSNQVGLSNAWGTIFFPYGPGENPNRLVSSVILSLLRGESPRCSHGNQIRDFLFVEDVASAFVALLDSNAQSSFNIASGQPITLKSIVKTISILMDSCLPIEFGAVPSSENEIPLLVANVDRIKTTLGWKPTYTLKSGLLKTIDWCRVHKEMK